MAILKTTSMFNRSDWNKVACIKAFRSISGLGLKDAKDAVENAAEGVQFKFDVPPHVSPHVLRDSCDLLEATGFIVSNVSHNVDVILKATRQSAIMATKCEDEELAALLLNVVVEYKKIQERRIEEQMAKAEARAKAQHNDKIRREKEEEIRYKNEKRWREEAKAERNYA